MSDRRQGSTWAAGVLGPQANLLGVAVEKFGDHVGDLSQPFCHGHGLPSVRRTDSPSISISVGRLLARGTGYSESRNGSMRVGPILQR